MPDVDYDSYLMSMNGIPGSNHDAAQWRPGAPLPAHEDDGVLTLENFVEFDRATGRNVMIPAGNESCIVYKLMKPGDKVRHTLLIDTVGGDVIAWSKAARPLWGGSRPFTKKEDGDGVPSNILDLVPENGSVEMFNSIAAVVDDLFRDSAHADIGRMREYINALDANDGGVMCAKCGQISIKRKSCDGCGAFFGELDMDNLARLDGADLTEYKIVATKSTVPVGTYRKIIDVIK